MNLKNFTLSILLFIFILLYTFLSNIIIMIYLFPIFLILFCILYFYEIFSKFKFKVVPSVLFLISFLIVNFQYFIDILLNNIDKDNKIFISEEIINKGILFSLIGFVSFLIGYFILRKDIKIFSLFKKTLILENNYLKKEKINKVLINVFFVINILAFFWYFVFITHNDLTGRAYMERLSNPAQGRGAMLYLISLFSIQVFFSMQQKEIFGLKDFLIKFPKVILFLSIAFISLKIVSGDRGPAIYVFLSYFWIYNFLSRKKISFVAFILLLSLGAFFVTAIGMGRSYSGRMSFAEKMGEGFNTQQREKIVSFSPYTQELAGSVRCNQILLDEVSNNNLSFQYGKILLINLLYSVPFVGTRLKTIFPDEMRSGSASFITRLILGDQPSYGVGTTCLADFYLDFGIVGVIFGMVIFGYLAKYVDNIAYSKNCNFFQISFYLCFAVCSIYIPRATCFDILFKFTYICFFYYVIIILFNFLNKKNI